MSKRAFIDATTGRLHAWGYVATNRPDDVVLTVPDDFTLDPLDGWRWDGSAWRPFVAPPPPPSELALVLDDALADTIPTGPKLKAVLAALRKVTR